VAAIFGYDDVGMHATMLVDSVRMRAFAAAIARVVKPGDVVVDVGAGSGVLALLAAKAGARRVYAVERGPMAKLIAHAAEKNGVADIVRVIRGDARSVSFDEPPTLIVSEMIGSFGLDEDYLGLLGSVRKRCAPGCRVLPAAIEMQLALAHLPALDEELATIRDGLGVLLDDVATALASRVALAWVDASALVSTATAPARFVLGDAPPKVIAGSASVHANANATMKANAIVGWFNADLVDAAVADLVDVTSEGITLSSAPDSATHWANVVFPLHPSLDVTAGDSVTLEVRPRVLTQRGTWSWRAASGGHVRSGDAMMSLVGDRADLMAQLGLHARTLDPMQAEVLPVWSAALAGGPADVDTLVRRLRAAFPQRYVDDADAEADVLRMVWAARE
jgi:precorrin-6B methylase 2